MNVGYLSRLFPLLTFLMLLGCPDVDSFNFLEREITTNNDQTSALDTTYSRNDNIAKDEDTNIISRDQKIKNILTELDSINASFQWKLIKDNLYINKKGQLGLQIDYATEVGNTKYYISNFTDNDQSLNKVIDTASFIHLGSTFYKDKNNIYHYFDMAYGGRFTVYNSKDYATFHVIGDHYAKDKHHIYGERAGVLKNVDYKTFTSEIGAGPYAKDKFGYYFWDELIMTHEEFYKKYKLKSTTLKAFSKIIQN
ncbi:hypothetical protein FF125_19035 [Aureibaculum algae]|uniref:Uncharacterized protein n=1 Tax=Aureibaculum algae TaxID=2584122 RepID=A0A5B7U0A6_9FLAO|nr:DKNYY domain-containing protein [Aureibaculum algae]QCX40437.1 hypothetical protein FF125_19035 [Aureibaculum algae]